MSAICKFYQQGYCRNGNRCNFSHGYQGYYSRQEETRYGYNNSYGNYTTSPNRVWLSPKEQARYEQSYQQERYQQSNQYDHRGYDDHWTYDNHRGYDGRRVGRYDDYVSQHSSHSGRSQSQRHHHKENSAPQTNSNFSFTKALESSRSSSNEQSSLQQRVKPSTSVSTDSSFSFVKALQESNKPKSAAGNSELYSTKENLSEAQKTQFTNLEFTWGKIPLLPPCAEYC